MSPLQALYRVLRTYQTRLLATMFALASIYLFLYMSQMTIASSVLPLYRRKTPTLSETSISAVMIPVQHIQETQNVKRQARPTEKTLVALAGVNKKVSTKHQTFSHHDEKHRIRTNEESHVLETNRTSSIIITHRPSNHNHTQTPELRPPGKNHESGIKPISLQPVAIKQHNDTPTQGRRMVPTGKRPASVPHETKFWVPRSKTRQDSPLVRERDRSTGKHRVHNIPKLRRFNNIFESRKPTLDKVEQLVNLMPNHTRVIVNILKTNRPLQSKALRQLRVDIRREIRMPTYDHLMLTRKNTKPGRHLHHTPANQTLARMYYHKVSREVFARLPPKISLPKPPYKVCSLVGSGGILKRSQCGRAIDQADVVFRFNLAETSGFENDVGKKTNMTTLNPSILKQDRWGYLSTHNQTWEFLRMLKRQRALIWAPTFGTRGTTFELSLKTFLRLSGLSPSIKMVLSDTSHFNAIQAMWIHHGLPNRLTTGFYFLTSALSLCNNINLYGFWPFAHAPDGRNVSYHYYDESYLSDGHNGLLEMKYLTAMHYLGLIKVHVGNCGT